MKTEFDNVTPAKINEGNVVSIPKGPNVLVVEPPEFNRSEGIYYIKGDDGFGNVKWYGLSEESYRVEYVVQYSAA